MRGITGGPYSVTYYSGVAATITSVDRLRSFIVVSDVSSN
jgi:hypothetical protein